MTFILAVEIAGVGISERLDQFGQLVCPYAYMNMVRHETVCKQT